MNTKIMAVSALAVVLFLLAGCNEPSGNFKPGKFTWVAEYIDDYDGYNFSDGIPLKVNLDTESDWINLLAVFSYKSKFIDLDISGSAYSGFTAFDPGKFKTGKRYILKLKLPDISTSVASGTRETPAFGFFSYLEEISGKNVEELGGYLFAGTVLKKIDFPALTSIGSYAFYNSRNLDSVTIPESMDSIKEGTFANSGIKNIVIPSGVESIEASAFSGCTGLTGVIIPNSVTNIGNSVFSNCSRLTSIDIPNSVTNIGSSAFSGCIGLTGVIIPSSVGSIEASAFSGCTGLTSVIIPNSVTVIGNSVFSNCSRLTSVIIPNSVTSIGTYAFSGCTELETITIPPNVITIGDFAFSGSSLKSVTIPPSVTSIGSGAFRNCKWLATVNISAGITVIRDYTFWGCDFESITIPSSVTSIESGAFRETKLKSVIIPINIGNIGDNAFLDCKNLATVKFEGASTTFSTNSFPGDLHAKYSTGGSGTYITPSPGNGAEWQK